MKRCAIEGCSRENSARGWCRTHYERWRRSGHPGQAAIPAYVGGSQHPQWSGDDTGYHGVHRRLTRTRGRAEDHSCARCADRAREWAYDHGDSDERIDARIGRPYSLNLDRYLPLCLSCHRTLDYAGAL